MLLLEVSLVRSRPLRPHLVPAATDAGGIEVTKIGGGEGIVEVANLVEL